MNPRAPSGTSAHPDFFDGTYVSFWIPLAVLVVALAIKLPSVIKLWRDPLLRAVGGLLLLGCGVYVFASPSMLAWTNRVTGVPNFAAPVVYSLITAFCGACLLLIIAWRDGRSDRTRRTRRATRWVITAYTGVIVALWVLFAFADAPVERLRDLDTYYATTAFMREVILLYLLAHTAACVITFKLIQNWIRTDGLDSWLRAGLRFLAVGHAVNLLYDGSKFVAVLARWTGHDLDRLSTDVAPLVACVGAVLIAVGFVLPHVGQFLQRRVRTRLGHWRLRPLYLLMRSATGCGVAFRLRAGAELRLTRRETFIRDALLHLGRYLDEDLRRRAYDAALGRGFEAAEAGALAQVVTVQDAVETKRRRGGDQVGGPLGRPDIAGLLDEIESVSRALRRTGDVEAVRESAAAMAESVPAP
ncbi:MAB_1171c family putative transporter [Streptomyces sp. NPDC058371]|uniref:MAB_1171c family putative transporter n=1 Tax=Streptomyces sp. NPDC058371 TaxID=3346463 RepID=UPI0036585F27